ncbi:MAG: hypothetical protein ACYC4H_04910 [Desulfocucumaceae bacterium]
MRIIEGGYDDRPLQGPWSRRREEQQAPPVKNTPEPDVDVKGEDSTGIETWEENVPGSEKMKEPPEKAVPRKAPAAEKPAAAFEEVVSGGRQDPETCLKAGPDLHCPGGERIRQRFTLRQFFSPSGLYAGIIMAEVLQSRGGRRGRR